MWLPVTKFPTGNIWTSSGVLMRLDFSTARLSVFCIAMLPLLYNVYGAELSRLQPFNNTFLCHFCTAWNECCAAALRVCPVRTCNLKAKMCRKTKIGVNVPQGRSNRRVDFQLKRLEVKVIGCQRSLISRTCLNTADGSPAGRPAYMRWVALPTAH